MNIESPYLKTILQQHPLLAAHPHLAEAITILGIDNHTSSCYYEEASFYLAKYADKFNIDRLEQACKVAHANDHLEQLVCGEHFETQKLIRSNEDYRYLDHFLDTVFGETDDSDPASPGIEI